MSLHERKRRAVAITRRAAERGETGIVHTVENAQGSEGERRYLVATGPKDKVPVATYWVDGPRVSYPVAIDPDTGEWYQSGPPHSSDD